MPRGGAKRKRNSTGKNKSASSNSSAGRPKTEKIHSKSENFEADHFPAERIIVETDSAPWETDPAEALKQVAKLCQEAVVNQRSEVYEIRPKWPIPWQHAVSNLVHRRCPKTRNDKKDKLKPRSTDDYYFNSVLQKHEAIRFFSSCVCSGCKNHDGYKPYILVYFALFSEDSAKSLESKIGMSIPSLREKRISEDFCKSNLIDRFFIRVIEPHHASCVYSTQEDPILSPTEVERWLEQLNVPASPPQCQTSSRATRASTAKLRSSMNDFVNIPDSPTVDISHIDQSSVVSEEDSSSDDIEPESAPKRHKTCEISVEPSQMHTMTCTFVQSTMVVQPELSSDAPEYAQHQDDAVEAETTCSASTVFDVDALFA